MVDTFGLKSVVKFFFSKIGIDLVIIGMTTMVFSSLILQMQMNTIELSSSSFC